ncbi:hypothetical protein PDQ79_34050 [Bacillus cereus]|nr:hypothetical protein [Bacillus cereus]
MNQYKKLAIVIPLTGMLGMGIIAPTTSSADELKTSEAGAQSNYIQGYLMKGGMMTPVKESGPASPEYPFPILPANPAAGVPQSGKSVVETGAIGDILYFEQETHNFPDGRKAKVFIQKTPDGIERGGYDPETLELDHTNKELEDKILNDSSIPQVMKDIVKNNRKNWNDMYSPIFDGTTKVKRETKYEILDKSTQDNAIPYTFNQTVTSGVSKEDVVGFASTMGWKIGAKAGLPGVGELSAEFSLNLTANYNHKISVTNSESKSHSYIVGKVDNPDYPYNEYTVAVYQLESTYTVIPGTGLQKVLDDDKKLGLNNLKALSKSVYKYKDAELYATLTPQSHLPAKK